MTETTGATDDPRLHVRVAEDVRKKIAAGVLAAGDAVSITYTSQEWGISRQTVSKALGTLERDGLLKRYPGMGYYVLPRGNPPADPREG
jgi:DNA-binding GntR family transcriptional regulator